MLAEVKAIMMERAKAETVSPKERANQYSE